MLQSVALFTINDSSVTMNFTGVDEALCTMSSSVSNVGFPFVSGRNIAVIAAWRQIIPIIPYGSME